MTNIQKTAYVVIAGTASSATINVPEDARSAASKPMLTLQPADWLRLGGSLTYTDASSPTRSRVCSATP